MNDRILQTHSNTSENCRIRPAFYAASFEFPIRKVRVNVNDIQDIKLWEKNGKFFNDLEAARVLRNILRR